MLVNGGGCVDGGDGSAVLVRVRLRACVCTVRACVCVCVYEREREREREREMNSLFQYRVLFIATFVIVRIVIVTPPVILSEIVMAMNFVLIGCTVGLTHK